MSSHRLWSRWFLRFTLVVLCVACVPRASWAREAPRAPGRVFVAAEKAANFVGGRADRLGEKLMQRRGPSRHAGRWVQGLFGATTLWNTSFDVGFAIGAGLPPPYQAVGGGTLAMSYWSGSLRYHQMVHRGVIPKDIQFVYGAGVGVAALVGYTKTNMGATYSLDPIPFLSAYKGTRGHGISFYIPNFAGGAIGQSTVDPRATKTQTARGPVLGTGLSVPAVFPGLYVGASASLYYPPLILLTSRMHRPAAWVDRRQEAIKRAFRRVFRPGTMIAEEPQGSKSSRRVASFVQKHLTRPYLLLDYYLQLERSGHRASRSFDEAVQLWILSKLHDELAASLDEAEETSLTRAAIAARNAARALERRIDPRRPRRSIYFDVRPEALYRLADKWERATVRLLRSPTRRGLRRPGRASRRSGAVLRGSGD